MLAPSAPQPHMMAGSTPEITYLGGAGTFSIGPARPDRIIVVATTHEDDTTTVAAMPTINGVAATIIDRRSAPDNMALGYAVVPTGTSVVVAGGEARRATWLITGVTTLDQAIISSGSTATLPLTGTMPAQPSAIIAIARSRSSMSAGAVSASGVMRDAQMDVTIASAAAASGWVCGHAYADGAGSGTINLTSGSAFSSGLAAAGVFK